MSGRRLRERIIVALDDRIAKRRVRKAKTYIVPTPLGGVFLLFTILLFVVAAAYRNDILYAQAFALLSLFFLAMIQTHGNLRGLAVCPFPLSDPFSGEEFTWRVEVENPRASGASALLIRSVVAHNANLRPAHTAVEVVFVAGRTREQVDLAFAAVSRGPFGAPRVLVGTRFPFGLFYAWRIYSLHTSTSCVLPRPFGVLALPEALSERKKRASQDPTELAESARPAAGEGSEPGDVRSFRLGDPSARILWRRYVPGRVPLVRAGAEAPPVPVLISEEAAAVLADRESRISQMCAWLVHCRAHGRPCAARFEGFHRARLTDADFEDALRALALLPRRTDA